MLIQNVSQIRLTIGCPENGIKRFYFSHFWVISRFQCQRERKANFAVYKFVRVSARRVDQEFLRCLSYDVSWFSWWVKLSNRMYQDSSWYLKSLIYPLLSTFQNGENNFDCPWIHYKSEVRTAKSCLQLNLETKGSTCSLNMTAAIWSSKDFQYQPFRT